VVYPPLYTLKWMPLHASSGSDTVTVTEVAVRTVLLALPPHFLLQAVLQPAVVRLFNPRAAAAAAPLPGHTSPVSPALALLLECSRRLAWTLPCPARSLTHSCFQPMR
jgi:hypothetical protein